MRIKRIQCARRSRKKTNSIETKSCLNEAVRQSEFFSSRVFVTFFDKKVREKNIQELKLYAIYHFCYFPYKIE